MYAILKYGFQEEVSMSEHVNALWIVKGRYSAWHHLADVQRPGAPAVGKDKPPLARTKAANVTSN